MTKDQAFTELVLLHAKCRVLMLSPHLPLESIAFLDCAGEDVQKAIDGMKPGLDSEKRRKIGARAFAREKWGIAEENG